MELLTKNIQNPEHQVPICVKDRNSFELEQSIPDRLQVVFIPHESGIIEIDSQPISFIAPAIFCINDRERVSKICLKADAKAVIFDTVFISKSITLSEIYKPYKECNDELRSNRLLFWPFINRTVLTKGIFTLSQPTALCVDFLIDQIADELKEQRDGWWPCRTRSYLSELLFLIAQLPPKATIENDSQFVVNIPEEIQPMVIYLYNNYNRKLTITDLAREFNTNRTTLNEKFKKYSGLTIIAFLIKLRLQIAAIMLRDTKLPLCEIFNRAGFTDSAYFSKLFKRQYGKGPTEFRKRRKEEIVGSS